MTEFTASMAQAVASTKQIEHILDQIKELSKNGKFQLVDTGYMGTSTQKKLEEWGYIVEVSENTYSFKIRWNHQPVSNSEIFLGD